MRELAIVRSSSSAAREISKQNKTNFFLKKNLHLVNGNSSLSLGTTDTHVSAFHYHQIAFSIITSSWGALLCEDGRRKASPHQNVPPLLHFLLDHVV